MQSRVETKRTNESAKSLAEAEERDSESKRVYPKTHANYWKSRLEHRSYTRDGQTFEVAEWSVRIHFKGIRKSFDLETGNKEEAAAKARGANLTERTAPVSEQSLRLRNAQETRPSENWPRIGQAHFCGFRKTGGPNRI
jgi:hypothetical protein